MEIEFVFMTFSFSTFYINDWTHVITIKFQTIHFVLIPGPGVGGTKNTQLRWCSRESGSIFSSKIKTTIIPVYKSGHRNMSRITNCRHISLLFQFSKISKQVCMQRLDNLIKKHFLLSDYRFGFGVNRSTSLTVMKLI